jgi:hypothetical protein
MAGVDGNLAEPGSIDGQQCADARGQSFRR